MDELYRSDDVVVRRVPSTDQSRWVVTFDNYSIGHGFDRHGFGEAYFQSHGVSAIHVMGRREDWYQYPEMAAVCGAIRVATAGATAVMTYGSSMGGYAALRFADWIGVTSALALSPQYSIDRAKMPGEPRWAHDARRIAILPEIDGPIRPCGRMVIVYDPQSLDCQHGERIAQDVEVQSIRLPYTDHPVTTYLSEVGLLTPLVMQTLDGTVDAARVTRQSHDRRRSSSVYLSALARNQPSWRPRTALALARRAVEVSPDSPIALLALARLLTQAKQHEEALDLHRRQLETTGRVADYLVPYANALFAAKDVDGACRIADEVTTTLPLVSHLHAWSAFLLWSAGRFDEARQAMATASALDPTNIQYEVMLATYRFGQPDPDAAGGVRMTPFVRIMRWWTRSRPRWRHADDAVPTRRPGGTRTPNQTVMSGRL